MLRIRSAGGHYNIKNIKDMKLQFVSFTHFIVVLVFALLAVVTFVGIFFNPFQAVFFIMSALMTVASYREKLW